ncbi:MAG: hypothetical protein QMD46_10730 [Methanomicrobiales archaeon]|nr:hypothetical protein [Methanomicrobiales archaeon]
MTVSEHRVEPVSLMRGDVGTVAVTVTNTGTESVAYRWAKLFGTEIRATADPYTTGGLLGPGTSKTFTFTVRADAADGIYYPVFLLDFRDAGQLRYPIPIRVESTELPLSLTAKPTYIVEGKRGDYTLLVGNPRDSAVNGVRVTPTGEGFEAAPSSAFIGTLAPDQSATVSFNITPARSTNVTFVVTYRNGVNEHRTELALPLTTEQNLRGADLILTNIEVQAAGGYYRLSGDITNAGLETAYAVVLRADASAGPVPPFENYVVGTLDPDDFASFELTFRGEGLERVPLIVEFKDDDGTLFTSTTGADIAAQPLKGPETEIPLYAYALVGLLVLGVAAAIVYSWRRA